MVIYNFGIHLFNIGLHITSLFKQKAKAFVKGRKNWEQVLTKQFAEKNISNPIWIHCASLGEFEQGRPVIEAIKQQYPSQAIILTFFSPSGYEVQKNYRFADIVCYLPIDTKTNAQRFLNITKPTMAIFVKYEFWLNYLFELHELNIPSYLISTVIKKHQSFFKWYGKDFRKALATYHIIFTQDKESLNLLEQLTIKTGKLAGDTRFDRVLQICSTPKQLPDIYIYSKNSFTIIAGSSWQQDEEYLIKTYLQLKQKHPQLKLIIAPHEIDKNNIERLKNLLHQNKLAFHLFTENTNYNQHSILIINTIGLLSSIYQYGNVAFIGGGFNNGIHNILEPMVYGLPVLFGPNYHKFNEAFDAIKENAGFEIKNNDTLYNYLNKFIEDKSLLNNASKQAKQYVNDKAGATEIILKNLPINTYTKS